MQSSISLQTLQYADKEDRLTLDYQQQHFFIYPNFFAVLSFSVRLWNKTLIQSNLTDNYKCSRKIINLSCQFKLLHLNYLWITIPFHASKFLTFIDMYSYVRHTFHNSYYHHKSWYQHYKIMSIVVKFWKILKKFQKFICIWAEFMVFTYY